MNSLQSYKDQCYNIGSPSPTPSKPPLTRLPKKLESEFDFSPLKSPPKTTKIRTKTDRSKIPTVSSSKKRKPETQGPPNKSPKKSKMCSKEEMLEMFAHQQENNDCKMVDTIKVAVEAAITGLNINSRMDGFSTKLDTLTEHNTKSNDAVQTQMTGVQGQMRTLQSSVDDNRIKFESKLVELEGQINLFQENALSSAGVTKDDIKDVVLPMIDDEVVPRIKNEVKREILSPIKATWNAMQAEKVFEHEHSLIIFGLNVTKNPIEAAGDFLKNVLKVSNENLLRISVKQAHKLGRGDSNRPPPLLIKFGHPSERNLVLTHSKNILDKSIKIEKHIPKNYQAQHKVFKELSWKLRSIPDMEYQVQIVFDGHFMVLRYKAPDTTEKFHWTTHSSWEPPMDSKNEQKTSLRTPTGSKATPAPSISVAAKANTAIFMTVKGMTEQLTVDSFKDKLIDYLNSEHKSLITDVKMTKRRDLFMVYCDCWRSAKDIATSYKSKFNNCDVSFTLFAQDDPALKH